MGKAGLLRIRDALFLAPWTEQQEAEFGASKPPGEAADCPGKVRRPWVTPTELTVLAIALHSWLGVGVGSPAAQSWGEAYMYNVVS